jgi:hypothetical protein
VEEQKKWYGSTTAGQRQSLVQQPDSVISLDLVDGEGNAILGALLYPQEFWSSLLKKDDVRDQLV